MSLALPFLAVGGAVLAATPHPSWLRELALADVAAAFALAFRHWSLKWVEKKSASAAAAQPEDDSGANRGARALAFEDRIDDAVARADRAARHAGLISLWWVPGVDVDATPDIAPLRALLAAELDAGSVLHFADDDRAWVLVDTLGAYEDLQAIQERLVQALVRQRETPLRTVASGCALAPLHGTEARDLIEFADAHQEHQIRIHPMQTFVRARPTLVSALDRVAV